MHAANRFSRRSLLKGIGAGALAVGLGSRAFVPDRGTAAPDGPPVGKDELFQKTAPPAKVGLLKGNDRRDVVYQALKKIEDQILSAIGNKRILIKPNFVSTSQPLAATHVDAVRAILDFLKPHHQQQIMVAESATLGGSTFDGFKRYGYLPLEEEYHVKLVDLNRQPWRYRYVLGRGNAPTKIRIISTFFDPDLYIISAAKMKTHDRVVTTLSLKNVLLGAPINDARGNDKPTMHLAANFSREAVLHYNMFQLAQEIYPDLGVIDGFEAMEGNGPVGGTPVDARIALASTDPLAMDMLATKLMGFDPGQIMYFRSMWEAGMGQGDLEKIEVLGTPVEQCRYKFKPNQRIAEAYGL
jgi:uncharacterized protein (DUF362 family)